MQKEVVTGAECEVYRCLRKKLNKPDEGKNKK